MRQGRDPGGWLVLLIALALIVAVTVCERVRPLPPIVWIEIGPRCVGAGDLAHRSGWRGSLAEYRVRVEELNPGLRWGQLQAGQAVRVEDWRAGR